jgi:hypothetical protein
MVTIERTKHEIEKVIFINGMSISNVTSIVIKSTDMIGIAIMF